MRRGGGMTRDHAGGVVCLQNRPVSRRRVVVDWPVTLSECERPRRRERRGGKNDLVDATLAARRLVSGEGLSTPRGGGQRDRLQVLLLERRGATRARTAALNQLHAAIVTAPAGLRARLDRVPKRRLVLTVARLRGGPDGISDALRRIARRIQLLTAEIDEIDQTLNQVVTTMAPDLLAECGVGPVCAAQLLVSSGDPHRMATEASIAALAGTSPLDASSGRQQRHRLNRGGDRQLNWALHVIALHRVQQPRPDQGLLPAAARRRKDRQGSQALHQTRPRPPLLPPATRTRTDRLDNIEASVFRRPEMPNRARLELRAAPPPPNRLPISRAGREREAAAYWDSLTVEQEVWALRKMGFFRMGRAPAINRHPS